MAVCLRAAMDGIGWRARRVSRRLVSATALLMVVAPVVWAGPSKSACDLFTVQEVAKVLGAAVSIEQDASGPDPNGGDNCVWTTADRLNIMVRVIAVPNKDFAPLRFKLESGNAFSYGKQPEVLTGIADEAKYRAYDGTLKGGVLVGRINTVVFVVEGSTTREHLIDFTKILLSRL